MSCYLVAYCIGTNREFLLISLCDIPLMVSLHIGQFDYVERESNNITFRVYTPPGKVSSRPYLVKLLAFSGVPV